VDALIGTLIGRWYVSIFGIAFAVNALRHLGPRRTALYTVAAIIVGVLAENGSVWIGFPYGYYTFNEALRGRELWVGDVPLMVPLSYTFMAYFAFATGRLLVAGPYRTRGDAPALEFCVAVMAAVWILWVIDPVSRLGEHYFLGHVFRYRDDGFWFGLHLRSQLGFTLTSLVLVGLLTWLAADEPSRPVDGLWRHPRLGGLGGTLGQLFFMAGTALWVSRTTSDPVAAKDAAALAGSAMLILVPVSLMTAVYWRSLRTRAAAQSRATERPPLQRPRAA
jgi:putative membrane protein